MKGKSLISLVLSTLILVGCGTGTNSSSSNSTDNPTSSTSSLNSVNENVVKIKKINVIENQVQSQNQKARNRKNANDDTEDLNYTIITRPQSEVQFTITLDNPKAYGINAIEIACDDENAEIMIEGEYKKISDYSIVLWSSENAYEKTYNIKTESLDALTTFTVTDIRLEGETKFQSELTNSTDLGNNELHIYKMDEDAYTLNVIENTFDYIKFNFNIKDEYKDIISNIKVDGLEMDEELGYWMLEESKDVSITYDYYLEEYDIKVSRKDESISLELVNTASICYDDYLANQSTGNDRYSPLFDAITQTKITVDESGNDLVDEGTENSTLIDAYIINIGITGTNLKNMLRITYKDVEVQLYPSAIGGDAILCNITNADFKTIQGRYNFDLEDKLDYFKIFINDIEYKFITIKLENKDSTGPENFFIISGLEKVEG